MGDEKCLSFIMYYTITGKLPKNFIMNSMNSIKMQTIMIWRSFLAYPISEWKWHTKPKREIKSFYLNDGCLHITGLIMDSSHCELIENIVEHAYSGLRYVYKAEDDQSRIYINTDTIRVHIKLALMVEIKDEMSAYTNEQQAIKVQTTSLIHRFQILMK